MWFFGWKFEITSIFCQNLQIFVKFLDFFVKISDFLLLSWQILDFSGHFFIKTGLITTIKSFLETHLEPKITKTTFAPPATAIKQNFSLKFHQKEFHFPNYFPVKSLIFLFFFLLSLIISNEEKFIFLKGKIYLLLVKKELRHCCLRDCKVSENSEHKNVFERDEKKKLQY